MEPWREEEVVEPREVDDLTFRRARRGDERASRDLVAHYQGTVFAFLGRLLGARRRELEEVAQETFLRVLRELPKLSMIGTNRLSGFILTVATRLGLEELRRPKSKLALFRDATAAAPGRAGVRAGDLGALVAQAAAALPPESRAILLLRDCHRLEYPEIARALEMDVGTVRARLSRARAVVRAAVAGVSLRVGGAADV